MPTIIVDKAKGLFQKAATSANPAGSFVGAKSVIKGPFNGVAAVTASLNDSGATFLLGSTGADTSVALPAMTTANIGWNCELVVTGALGATHVIQTVNLSTGETSASDRFLLSVADGDGGGEVAKVTVGADNKLDFLTGCADTDDACVVEVKYIAKNKAIVKGVSLS